MNKYPMSLLSVLVLSRVYSVVIYLLRSMWVTAEKSNWFKHPTLDAQHPNPFDSLNDLKTRNENIMTDTHPAHLPPSELGTKD